MITDGSEKKKIHKIIVKPK